MASRSGPQRGARSVVLGAAAILAIAVCLGLVANRLSSRGVPLFASDESLRPPLPPAVRYVSLDEARRLLHEPDPLFLDARAPKAFAAGHVPGALNLLPPDFEKRHHALRKRLQAAGLLIVYCHDVACADAARLSHLLTAAGYPHTAVMFQGWEGWQRAGYPWSSEEQTHR